jgi:glutathione S-transferase
LHSADVITLHTFPGRFGLESTSPFCMKVETYLKVSGLPYKTVVGNPMRAPKSKLPFIEDRGQIVADSSVILEHLEQQQKSPLDEGLTDTDRARARLIQRTLEDGLYFVMLWSRWVDDKGWGVTQKGLGFLPPGVRLILGPIIRRQNTAKVKAQGTGKHKPHEIEELGRRDIDALSVLLGEWPFFLGDKLRTIDLTAYAFLANILKHEDSSSIRSFARSKKNLVAFVDRVERRVAEGATAAK